MIPYWKKTGAFAQEHGVSHIAFEMHPGFCVYNPATLLRLRAAVGPEIGANFDSWVKWARSNGIHYKIIEPLSTINRLTNAQFK